jgi:hypothetical protein
MRSLLINILFCALPLSSVTAQIKPLDINARKYVYLRYRQATDGVFDTIWKWRSDNIASQRYNYLDIEGEIRIDFDQQNLINNKDFEGTLSLEAELSGASGNRKIEVNPFSEIGIERTPIGIKSEPPSQISKKLINMLLELYEAPKYFDEMDVSKKYLKNMGHKAAMDQMINELSAALNSPDRDLTRLKRKIRQMYDYSTNFYITNSTLYTDAFNALDLVTFEEAVDRIIRDYNSDNTYGRDLFVKASKEALEYINSKTEVVDAYLNSFNRSGSDAVKAYLHLLNKDSIGYSNLMKSVKKAQELKLIDLTRYKDNDAQLDTILYRKAPLIIESITKLYDLSRFQGSQLEKIIDEYVKGDTISASSYEGKERKRLFRKQKIYENFEEIEGKLTAQAGKLIYRKLIPATIDIAKSGAKVGEVLNIYLIYINENSTLKSSPRMPIGKFYIRETGWKFEITDMFALIKRQHERDVDRANLSPTNFKGSGGAVLMWTYQKKDKGMEIIRPRQKSAANSQVTPKTPSAEEGSKLQNGTEPKESVVDAPQTGNSRNNKNELRISDDSQFPKTRRKNKIGNFLQPSIGLNVSYLDFSTDKDVEIGTGLQIGLFRNKIFFGYGVNLHMISPQNQAPTYIYLGFSFAKLQDLFKSANYIVSVPD